MASLSEWLAHTGTPVAAVADHCGVAKSTVYRWRDGIKVPRPQQAAKLAELTGGKVTAADHQDAYLARTNGSLMGNVGASHGEAMTQTQCAPAHGSAAE